VDCALKPEPESARTPAARANVQRPAGLTTREAELLRLLAQGLSDAAIVQKLVISPCTVNSHLTSIYSKLDVSSRAAATRFAVDNGLAQRGWNRTEFRLAVSLAWAGQWSLLAFP
jgi:DNA-binding NarL/FixJ family response regulator